MRPRYGGSYPKRLHGRLCRRCRCGSVCAGIAAIPFGSDRHDYSCFAARTDNPHRGMSVTSVRPCHLWPRTDHSMPSRGRHGAEAGLQVSTYRASTFTPYELTVQACVCDCGTHPKILGHFKSLDRAIVIASGYWNVYYGFWGDQTKWIQFDLTDTRTGQLVWRNGATEKAAQDGKDTGRLID